MRPGASAEFRYAQGWNAISPLTRKPEPDEREWDVILYWAMDKTSRLRGLRLEVSAGVVDTEGSNTLAHQIRLIVNYALPLL